MTVINFGKAIRQRIEMDDFFVDSFSIKGGVEIPDMPDFASDSSCKDEVKGLDEIASRICACKKCELSGVRKNPVPGEGSPNSDLVFVGEAPGADEDEQGRPFVGRSGQLLTKIIAAMGLSREQVFICNTVKCRPPENRDPAMSEKDSCNEYLVAQLAVIKPKVIVALGSHAAKTLLKKDVPIGKIRGHFQEYIPAEGCEPIKLMPTYHPAYLLRSYSVENRKKVWDDMQKVMAELGI